MLQKSLTKWETLYLFFICVRNCKEINIEYHLRWVASLWRAEWELLVCFGENNYCQNLWNGGGSCEVGAAGGVSGTEG